MDTQLLLGLQQHQDWAQRKLYNQEYRLFVYLIRLWRKGEVDHFDMCTIINDTFLNIFKNISYQYTDTGHFSTWCTRILRNRFLNYCREKKYSMYPIDAVVDIPLEINYEAVLDVEILDNYAQIAVSANDYTILQRYVEGYSYNDISKEFKQSEVNIRNRNQSTIHILKEFYEKRNSM